jgi:ribulose-phosphate 3-epimerase
MYLLEDGFFTDLRRQAERRGLQIRSCFASRREIGGFFAANPHLERAARISYERLIQIAALLGADSTGGTPGSVYRDRMETKAEGLACYLRHMRELMVLARKMGLKALSMENMSCLAEPPTLPEEFDQILGTLNSYYRRNPDTTVPVRVCADIAHGLVDRDGRLVHDNWSLFEKAIPYMSEFHLKNTDERFEATFGFSAAERARGIVDLHRLKDLFQRNARNLPVEEVFGYLELSGPKLGRDYSDWKLEGMIAESVGAIREVFG